MMTFLTVVWSWLVAHPAEAFVLYQGACAILLCAEDWLKAKSPGFAKFILLSGVHLSGLLKMLLPKPVQVALDKPQLKLVPKDEAK